MTADEVTQARREGIEIGWFAAVAALERSPQRSMLEAARALRDVWRIAEEVAAQHNGQAPK